MSRPPKAHEVNAFGYLSSLDNEGLLCARRPRRPALFYLGFSGQRSRSRSCAMFSLSAKSSFRLSARDGV